MFLRLLNPSPQRSFFLFGARGTGKSTWITKQWGQRHHYISLLLETHETRYARAPDLLISDVAALKPLPEWVVLDEVQKVPRLLDVVHELIETTKIKFALTGSSARKLKAKGTNLLAGRAFHYRMFPLTHREIGSAFDLDLTLKWGALPSLFTLNDSNDRAEYLRSYTSTYLREEILLEQIVKSGVAFRLFLEVAAQTNGQTVNFAKIASDVGVDPKTIQNFFQILEDTNTGTLIPAYHRSTRKSLKHQPKFYLFDLGIKRAVDGTLGDSLKKGSSAYGLAFEHFMVMEIIRLNEYLRKDFQISHYQTTAGGEIDLILSKGRRVIAVEIKSTERVHLQEVTKLSRIAKGSMATDIYYVSADPIASTVGDVKCLFWKDFLNELF